MKTPVDYQNAEELLEPVKALNTLALQNVEKLVALQSKYFAKYSAILLENIKEASEVKDLEQSKVFFEKQGELSKKVAEDFSADVKEVAELTSAYAADVRAVISANVEKAVDSVKLEVPARAKKAPAQKAEA